MMDLPHSLTQSFASLRHLRHLLSTSQLALFLCLRSCDQLMYSVSLRKNFRRFLRKQRLCPQYARGSQNLLIQDIQH